MIKAHNQINLRHLEQTHLQLSSKKVLSLNSENVCIACNANIHDAHLESESSNNKEAGCRLTTLIKIR